MRTTSAPEPDPTVDPWPVDQATVVRHWLRRESDAAASGRAAGPAVDAGANEAVPDPDAIGALSDREALDALLRAKPGAANVLARGESVEWYRTAVDGDGFRALRLIESPPGMLWRSLAPDRSPTTAARTILRRDPQTLACEAGVDVDRVLAIRDALDARGGPAPALIALTRRGRAPWTVVDGNHRAVARAIELVDADARVDTPVAAEAGSGNGSTSRPRRAGATVGAGGFPPQPLYLGVRPNPVLRPVLERLGGVVRGLLGRGTHPL